MRNEMKIVRVTRAILLERPHCGGALGDRSINHTSSMARDCQSQADRQTHGTDQLELLPVCQQRFA